MLNIAVVAALLVVFGATAGWAQAPGQADVRLGIPYGPDLAQQLDLCLPATKQAAGYPAVVMIHGGYWTLGDKGADDPLCKGAAEQGIVAATIGYRLANTSEHNRWPAQLVDAQLAVRWLRSHAAEFGVDPSRICALGDSAGAHLAVFLAVLDHTVSGDYSGQLPNASSRVACAVDNFGPVDLSADSYWPPDLALFGSADRTQVKDQERAASPIFLAGPGSPPIMIAHGRADKAVNIDQSMQLSDHLKQAHVPVRMIVVNGGHEFEGLSNQEVAAIFEQEFDFIKHPRGR